MMLVTKFFSLHKSKICVCQKKVVTLQSKSFSHGRDFVSEKNNAKIIAYEKSFVSYPTCMLGVQL